MKHRRRTALFVALFALIVFPNLAKAQGSMAAAQPHIDKAKAAAWRPGDGLNDLTHLYEVVCAPAISPKGPSEPPDQASPPLSDRKVPARNEWYQEPVKVFDNLYWLGSWGNALRVPPGPGGDSTWAVTTSDGIILIDSGYDYSAPVLITEGLKKMGLNPAQIKYVILSHAHGDRYFGSSYIQATYHSHVIMSAADWDVLAKSDEPNEIKPKKDIVATDGMKVTLGDTTLTLYLTPGHTPGTISTIVPLRDGNERHVGAVWGGINPSLVRYRVNYFPDWQTALRTWSASAARFQRIANDAGVDTYLTIHPFYDNALEKLHMFKYRQAGDPNPLVSKDNFNRFMTIMKECTDAQLARIVPETNAVSSNQQ